MELLHVGDAVQVKIAGMCGIVRGITQHDMIQIEPIQWLKDGFKNNDEIRWYDANLVNKLEPAAQDYLLYAQSGWSASRYTLKELEEMSQTDFIRLRGVWND